MPFSFRFYWPEPLSSRWMNLNLRAILRQFDGRMVTAASAVAALLVMVFFANAQGASLRCPTALAGLDPNPPGAPLAEAAEITALWRGLGLPGTDGSDGPLGCPLDVKVIVADPGSGWSGVEQRFQRGAILIGNGSNAGMEVAAVRGLGGWFVWWKAPAVNFIAELLPSEAAPSAQHGSNAPVARWSFGGFVLNSTQTNTVALWRCSGSPCSWTPATPLLDGLSRPFDTAAKLAIPALAEPDPAAYAARVNALFAPWLPCYTVISADNAEPGEDTIARANVMMRGLTACPLTGVKPASVVNQWLAGFQFPSDQLPGTDTSDWPCKRHGDLDIMVVQLLHMVLQHQEQFSAVTMTNVRNILAPWGGTPRSDPYITPNGSCLGYSVIETENHILMQETGRYLSNWLRGVSSSANRDYLLRFLQQLVRRDFYEFNSIPYTRYHLKPLHVLHDYAPDAPVRTVALGVIDWVFAKEALSANMDRDHRPYRRQPRPTRYADLSWWGLSTTASTAQAALFAGPLQHVHSDIDLELNNGMDDSGDPAFTDPFKYPALGAGDEIFLDEFTDISETSYALPAALRGWLGPRFSDQANNRVSYIQAFHHFSATPNDPSLFLQPNQGVELVSGNRNWTIIAGGNAVPPKSLPDPPRSVGWTAALIIGGASIGAVIAAAVALGFSFGPLGIVASVVVGLILGSVLAPAIADKIAKDKQTSTLWSDQAGILRETTLIPSAVGLDRSQTIRFGQPLVNSQDAKNRPRLCVAEGFLCGFDLVMPNRPFPAKDSSQCPLPLTLAPAAVALTGATDDTGVTILKELGCLVIPSGDSRGWTIWTFERGMVVVGTNDPAGKERTAVLWIQDDGKGKRLLRLRWTLPGQNHDWYNVHVYNTDVTAGSGDAPGGDIRYANSGDPENTNTWDHGEVTFPLDGVADSTWSVITEGCDPTYGFLGIRTGHSCHADVLPRLTVTVAVPAAQSFSCDAHDFRGAGLVMETGGSCSSSPYGMFTYVWVSPCTGRCPPGANNFGFVVVAPSRGWTWREFGSAVELSIAGHDYLPLPFPNTVDVPISPPVRPVAKPDGTTEWVPTGPATVHTVTFRFTGESLDQGNILGDTGAVDVFGPLLADPENWPTARGHIVTPDLPGSVPLELLHSSGAGCFTMRGLPALGAMDPLGLLVDLRNASAPVVTETASSKLAAACP